jgi:uncharacterized protein YbjT (DUF2867 family)
MMEKTALLIGASGLVGSHCLKELLWDSRWSRVRVLARRPLNVAHPKLEVRAVDLKNPERLGELLRADAVFSCVGTTRAKTKSKDEYREIDFGIPVGLAKAALVYGAKQFLIVSSVGADPQSKWFYPRLKGEIDEAVKQLPFESVHIFRPSLLLGKRQERRLGEAVMVGLAPFYKWMIKGPKKPIKAEAVGKAMVRAAAKGAKGVYVYDYASIMGLLSEPALTR